MFSSSEEIYLDCSKEIYRFCYERSLPDTWAYLYKRWYCPERWAQWSRSSLPLHIPAGKTTMFIESHWKVLKRCHLYRFNRARLDLLVFILIDRHCRSLMHKLFRDVVNRASTTRWDQLFCSEWNRCYSRSQDPMGSYVTDVSS